MAPNNIRWRAACASCGVRRVAVVDANHCAPDNLRCLIRGQVPVLRLPSVPDATCLQPSAKRSVWRLTPARRAFALAAVKFFIITAIRTGTYRYRFVAPANAVVAYLKDAAYNFSLLL